MIVQYKMDVCTMVRSLSRKDRAELAAAVKAAGLGPVRTKRDLYEAALNNRSVFDAVQQRARQSEKAGIQ